MKNLVLTYVVRMSKMFIYAFLIQCLTMSLLFAWNGNAQIKSIEEVTVRIPMKGVSAQGAFKKIEGASGFHFVYLTQEVRNLPPIFIEGHSRSLYDMLVEIARQTKLEFKQINQNIHVQKSKKQDPFGQISIVHVEVEITGTVTDSNGTPLPGVTVSVPGTAIGTATDLDGKYTLSVPEGSTLVFSFIGFESQQVSIANRSEINVVLIEEATSLDEVVVTALGISREKKSLGYSTQRVDGSRLNEAPASNFVNSLAGKVAGVQISSSGGVGSSSRITIRGESSLNIQGNQPLFIIDGVPVGNDGVNNTSSNADYGNSAAEINPADIESMNVLKGPAAAALYGSRAANGAIVITTKKGSAQKGMDVSFNTYYFVEEVAWLPKFQNDFGQGRDGLYEGSNFGASWSIYPDGVRDGYDESWGPRLDNGTLEKQFDSPTTNGFRGGDVALNNRGEVIATPWVSHPNNIKDFFDTGNKVYNNLSLSGGNERSTYRLSLTSLNEMGVIPNNNLDRYQINLNTSYKLTNKLTSSVNFNYMKQKSTNRPDNGYGRNTIMYFFTWMTRQVDINSLRDYWQPGLEGLRQFQYNYGENHNNPFFLMYENTKAQDKDRIFGNLSLEYAFSDKLKLQVRMGEDLYHDFRPMKWAVSTVDSPKGSYQETRLKHEERNTDLLLTYTGMSADFGYVLSAGANRFDQSGASLSAHASELLVPGVYNLGNTSSLLRASNHSYKKRINSVYGLANLNYKGLLYLDLTMRNDWSSTLPSNNNSYFYPSVGINSNIRDILAFPAVISQTQLRASWAQVGNDAAAYSIVNTYRYGTPWGNNYSLIGNSTLMNSDLKPEITSTYEVGTSLGFWDNTLGLDITYYDIRSKNQILSLPMVQSSGQSDRIINAGEIKNTGVEVMLSATPVNSARGFQWNFNINWSHNTGMVVALTDEVDKIVQSAPGENASIQARAGEKMGAIWGPGYQRVPDGPLKGEIIIDNGGRAKATTEDIYLGNVNPDWIGGIYNSFTYKNIHLNFLFAGQVGGKFVSRFYNKAAGSGQLIESSMGRSARAPGTEYDDTYYAPGAALMADGTYRPNSTGDPDRLDAGVYGTDIRNLIKGQMDHISEAQLFSSSYFKLRELSVGYSLPQKMIDRSFIKSAKISLTGRNLLLFRPKSNQHFDPEVSVATTGNGLVPGFENMSLPSTREIGASLNLNF